MEGCGETFLKAITKTLTGRSVFNYLEIGIGYAGTLGGVCDLLAEQKGLDWHAYGIDLPNGWSYEAGLVNQLAARYSGRLNIILKPSTEALVDWKIPLHVVLVDGCHEKECCKKDFELVAPHVVQGGIVAFHDSGQNEQGGSIQPHNGQPIGVRDALKELLLLSNKREGWKTVADYPDGIGPVGIFITRKV
jgi:hypothetical protein